MGDLPKGDVSISSLHIGMLQDVVPSAASDVLLYSYSRSFNGFAAKLTIDEANEIRASTIDRKFVAKVKLGNGQIYEGATINTFDLEGKMYPFIYGGDAPNATLGPSASSFSRYCFPGSLNTTLVKGKIVFCEYFTDPEGVLFAGAAGAVFQEIDFKDYQFSYPLPLSSVNMNDGRMMLNYLSTTENTTATIFRTTQDNNLFAPFVVSFSSRGPNPITADILKPDLTAPGVDILAAWSEAASVSDSEAMPMTSKNNIEAEFSYGAGYTVKNIQLITGNSSSCSDDMNGMVWDLNYPSFALSSTPGKSITRVFHRTVTNVGPAVSTYSAVVDTPQGLIIQVQPSVLSFEYVGQTQSFVVTVAAELGNSMISGSLIWDDGDHKVYIVYMGDLPKGDVSISSLHIGMLQDVVPSKIIGARYYLTDGENGPGDFISPRDAEGHGTHTSSTAAGGLGATINIFDLEGKMYPFIYGGDAPNATLGPSASYYSRFCYPGSLNSTLVQGKIVFCEYFTDPGGVMQAGAAGAVFQELGYKDYQFSYPLPLSSVNMNDGRMMLNYLNTTENPTATIFRTTQDNNQFAPFVVTFSSRGPNPITADILKLITGNSSSCSDDTNGTVWDLNYPSFALSSTPGKSITRVFHRTVTNVGPAVSTYSAVVDAPQGLIIQVQPSVLSFEYVGQTQSFVVTVAAELGNSMISGSLIWDDGEHKVKSPIVAYASVHIVYMGDLPKGEFSAVTLHNNMLEEVVGSKIIGARYYRANGDYGSDDFKSPRDSEGHGSHTSSIAAGAIVSNADLYSFRAGTAHGGVPSARIAVYKICWYDGCNEEDILAAFDDAIADGVDIISLSVGGIIAVDYFSDSIAIGAFHSMKHGILTSNSAGNGGPYYASVVNLSPWSLSVGASTIDRRFQTVVKLGNGKVFKGTSVNTFDLEGKFYPLIWGGDAPKYNGSDSGTCLPDTLDETLVKGKIVLCDYVYFMNGPLLAGAVGALVRDDLFKDFSYTFPLPTSTLELTDGSDVFHYINTTEKPTATILRSTEENDELAPYVVSFSSRGPNILSPDILKVYIVYMGDRPNGEFSAEKLHSNILEQALGSGGSSSLLHSYHRSFNGFVAKLTEDDAKKLAGPYLATVTNVSPWSLSVAASTIDRKFATEVMLGNGEIYKGLSINTIELKDKIFPLIYGGDAPNTKDGYDSSESRYCWEDSLDKALVAGKIVLCDEVNNGEGAVVAGAIGAIMEGYLDSAFNFPLPVSCLGTDNGTEILNYLNSTRKPTATIFKSIQEKDEQAPYVISFSSRGPNPITNDILKPDLTAPGVDILAAWSQGTTVTGLKAVPLSRKTNTDAEFAFGSGHLIPSSALDPGLVYDAGEIDYVKFLCGQGYDTKTLRLVTGDKSSCSKSINGTAWDLNYPSFTLSTTAGKPITRVFHRTVTNVGSGVSVYKARVKAPSGLKIAVEPNVLGFKAVGETKSFVVKIKAKIDTNSANQMVSGSLIWEDGVHLVRSPVVAFAVQEE
ncbi:hypothetical protein V6N11_047126 [Hibiscus sabdariffa]|uniref:Cucumisin n=1 Tax=Hibiscus sabdariffa TaxID=183260 RepID=A0ABR2AD40_9ROSI